MSIPTKESISKAFNSFRENPTNKEELITLYKYFHNEKQDVELSDLFLKAIDNYIENRSSRTQIDFFQFTLISLLKG